MNTAKLCANNFNIVSETPNEIQLDRNSIIGKIRKLDADNRFIFKKLMSDISGTLEECGNPVIHTISDDEYNIWIASMVLTLKEKNGKLVLVKLDNLNDYFKNNTSYKRDIERSNL